MTAVRSVLLLACILLFVVSVPLYLRLASARATRMRARRPRLGEPNSSPRPSERPPPLAIFRGRAEELNTLTARFYKLRDGTSHGAIILAIHGMPGVGKSALAHELARRLSVDFPDGLLYANLGNAGGIRAEADILNGFLLTLGIPRQEIPAVTADRAALFRSATASKSVLIILDAARDHEQVARLLPSGEACAVIVTSRRDLGPGLTVRSLQLMVPDTDVALDILRSVSGTEFGQDQKYAIEIVRRVGRHPLAIRAAGDEVLQGRRTIREVARALREAATRDELLRGHGRGVEERIETEYGRLTAEEQRALLSLSLIDSPSFVPWVLVPLLEMPADEYVEAEKLISRLAERQLLEQCGTDVTGLDRYRFHPLVRFFAEHRRHKGNTETAIGKLTDAYLEGIDLILAEIDPEYRAENPPPQRLRWYPPGSITAGQIAKLPERWVRTEHVNLRRCVIAAFDAQRWTLCWQIAAHLGDSAPLWFDRHAVRDALEYGRDAARSARSPRGEAEVLLATGSWLFKIGDYAPAFDAFDEAAFVASRMREARPRRVVPQQRRGPRIRHVADRLESESYRRLAEAYLRLGAYRDAGRELTHALQLAERAGLERQRWLIELMRCHIVDVDRTDIPAPDPADDEMTFWYESALAVHERRQQDFPAAAERLRRLRHQIEDDASRTCDIFARLAENRLDELLLADPDDRSHARQRALHRAAETTNRYQILGDEVGSIRARCILLRALVELGWTDAAEQQLAKAKSRYYELNAPLKHDNSTTRAALLRAEGALRNGQGRAEDARTALALAARLFRAHGDRLSEQSVCAMIQLAPDRDAATAGQPPRREPAVQLQNVGDTLRVGYPFTLVYTIEPTPLIDGGYPARSRYITVMIVADGADVHPTTHAARLDSWAALEPQEFQITPTHAGVLEIRCRVYAAREGTLLMESCLPPRPVVASAHQDASV